MAEVIGSGSCWSLSAESVDHSLRLPELRADAEEETTKAKSAATTGVFFMAPLQSFLPRSDGSLRHILHPPLVSRSDLKQKQPTFLLCTAHQVEAVLFAISFLCAKSTTAHG
jgi:hypothetical protein